jgi:hypothetical protein
MLYQPPQLLLTLLFSINGIEPNIVGTYSSVELIVEKQEKFDLPLNSPLIK